MSGARPKFWRPGAAAPGSGLQEERSIAADASEGAGQVKPYNPNANLSIERQRQTLPIFRYRNHILYLLEKRQTLVVVGETGCGKSTQLPQYLLEAGWAHNGKLIGVTQPRRVAVVSLATRVAEERACLLGQDVGYAVRFEDCWDQNSTKIKYVTDGLLVRELMSDPLLTKYSILMLDEAHERTLHTDIVIGLLKKVQAKRPDLRIIIASATLDAELFFNFFNTNDTADPQKDTASILTVEGRAYPVDVYYSLDPVPDYVKATVETVIKLHKQENEGHVLVFLTGMEEVENAVSLLIDEARRTRNDGGMKMRVLSMYGGLPATEQMKVFERVGRNTRKIVVATNIAEASLTIPGIVYVVDCGFVKLRAYNPRNGLDCLVVTPASQASAEQRAGRAGRVRSGKVYRLYTEAYFGKLPVATVPEMQRTNLAGVVLQLKALGVNNVLRFPFLSPPPAENLVRGVELLFALGALDMNARLTLPFGLHLAEFPLPPMPAKMLLVSQEFKCSKEAVIIAAMMQIQTVFVTPSGQRVAAQRARRLFAAEEGDHISLLNVYLAFQRYGQNAHWCHENFLNYKGLLRAVEIHAQLLRLMHRFKVDMVSCDKDVDCIQRCITAAFFPNAAKLHSSGEYRSLRDSQPLHIHPTSVLYPEKPAPWLVFNDVVQSSKNLMLDVTVIEPEWLYELAPHFYEFGTEREVAAKRAKLSQ